MRKALVCATVLVASLAGGVAFPCGASFGENISVDPHQDIMIAWKNGVETYVFQPTFCGTATDFGLILPVPAPLSSEPSLFEQAAFSAAVALSEPTKRQVVHQQVGCGGNDSATAGGSRGIDDEPAVVASGRVGFLDWVQLKADTPSSFTDWLTANGYPYSGTATDVFSYYVSKGWYFLAFRITQNVEAGGATICQALGPVALSFPTAVPVVPSRMASASGASGASLWWRIFGITGGDSQLSFPNASNQNGGLWYSGAIQAADVASFGGLAEPGDRLTRLILTIYPGSTTADAPLTLAPPSDYRGTQDVEVSDESACSVKPHGGRLPPTGVLSLFGLAMVGLFCWRRWR